MNKEQRFSSVWDAIEDTVQAAASMRARSDLLMALQLWVKASQKTQAEVSRLFGITQPRMSDLMRGKISLFSLDALMDMATMAGLEPQITVKMATSETNDRGVDEAEPFSARLRASDGVICEFRPARDDGDEFFVVAQGTTESSSVEAPRKKAQLTRVA